MPTKDELTKQVEQLSAQKLEAEERVRELQLDLMRTRDKGRRNKQEADSLLESLRLLTDSNESIGMFERLLSVLTDILQFESAVVLVETEQGKLIPTSSTNDLLTQQQWKLGPFFKRVFEGATTAAFDVRMIDEWKPFVKENDNPFVSALHVPFTTRTHRAIFIGTHHNIGYFTERHVQLAERLAPVATQALRAAELRDELIKQRDTLEERVAERAHEVLVGQLRYQKVVDAALDAVIGADSDSIINVWNKQAEEIFGWSEEEAVGMRLDETIIPPPMRAMHNAGMVKYLETGEGPVINNRIEIDAQHRDGHTFPIELSITPLITEQETTFSAFVRDITERRETEQSLLKAKEAAEAADRAKSEFLANMSHEIRTPMNAIIGLAGLVLDTELDREQRDFVETVRRSGNTLLTIINDILDFSKIEAGKLELEEQPFDLRNCLEEALDLFGTEAGRKQIDLAYVLESDVPDIIVGDVTRLRQVLVNLISNAIKFTDSGEVVVSAESVQRQDGKYTLKLSVRDSGIGIAPEQRDRLFKSFSQVDASTTRRYGGTGLGLAISKQLVEMMGGEISVESQLGQGATFIFTVVVDGIDDDRYAYLSIPQPQLRGQRVLVVDDNATNRLILERQTMSWGMEPVTIGSGRAALKHLQTDSSFDVAILDVFMPEMDGITLGLRMRERYPTLPIIILSSSGRSESGADQLDIIAYLNKPLRPSQLYDVLLRHAMKTEYGGQTARKPKEVSFDRTLGERHPLRILIAEDNSVNQKVALNMLHRLGYRADVVGNGEEAVEAIDRQQYDVVLMDIQMPQMDGVAATQHIRENHRANKRPRIIAVTAHALEGDREKYLNAGMDDYISKPISVDALINALETATVVGSKPVEPSPIDFGVLHAQFGDDAEAILDDLLPMYITETKPLIVQLEADFESADSEAVWKTAHAIKSSSATLGATTLAAVCSAIETAGKSGDLAAAQEHADAVIPAFTAIEQFAATR